MADTSLSLRIASIFIVWTASAIGVSWPFLVKGAGSTESEYFRMMKACAAGVMLGIALMHLLPDSDEDLQEIAPDYCLAFAMTAAGVVLNLALEQIALICLAARKREKMARKNSIEVVKIDSTTAEMRERTIEHGEHCGFVKCEHSKATDIESAPFSGVRASHVHAYGDSTVANQAIDENTQTQHGEVPAIDESTLTTASKLAEDIAESEADDEGEMIANLMDAKTMRDMISLYAMELSISVHSIIIGVDIGLLAGNDQIPTLVSLLVAICFHQFVEGSGLGTILRTMRNAQGNTKVIIFVLMFAMTTPLGIFIGIMTSSQPQTPSQVATKGIANALACGSLLYISLTEMIATYFTSPDLIDKPVLKLKMIATFTFGIIAMAIIAIWA